MKYTIKNLGFIDKAELTPGKLTIICGPNNRAKTYINYSIFGFLNGLSYNIFFEIGSYLEDLFKEGFCKINLKDIEKSLHNVLKESCKNYSNSITDIFAAPDEFFKSTSFNLTIKQLKKNYQREIKTRLSYKEKRVVEIFKPTKEHFMQISILSEEETDLADLPEHRIENFINSTLANFFFRDTLKKPFVITSERTGISLFYKELDINKNILVEQLTKKKVDFNPFEIINEMFSRYATSIKSNIDTIRNADIISKSKSFISQQSTDEAKNLFKLWEKIIQGKFKIVDSQILYIKKGERNREKVTPMPMYITSSTIKSLFLFDLYLRYLAQENEVLLIDEPELNLHPDNQILIARFLATLVNFGIDVIISTHSDFILKEINNLIMLSNDINNKDVIMKKYKYTKCEILKPSDVKVYYVNSKHTLDDIKIDNTGIDLVEIDKIINDINETSNKIYYSINKL